MYLFENETYVANYFTLKVKEIFCNSSIKAHKVSFNVTCNISFLSQSNVSVNWKKKLCVFSQISDIPRNVLNKFTEPNMEWPCWCKSAVHLELTLAI